MASTGPVKSQALHNFALSPLKWKNNHPRAQSPMREVVLGKGKDVLDFTNHALDCDQVVGKSERKSRVSSEDRGVRSKLMIRIPAKGRGEADEVSLEEGDETMGKMWNLRPRKAVKKSLNVNGGGLKNGGCGGSVQGKSDVLQKGNGENGSKKKETKVKFSVSLTRAEIEEDVFSFTGSKPSRRPKKRAKAVEKQLDNLFPGLWLASITPDTYKVSENYMKG